jgi:hypothetical protein
MECKKENNLKDCPCTYSGCSRKGVCCECLKHHLSAGELPGCCFSEKAEKTFDRSIANFIKDQGL